MKGKELRALITLAGKVDPSLQAAMLKASNQGKKTSGAFNKALGSMNKGMLSLAGKISPAFQAGLTKVESGATKAFGVIQKGAGYVGKGLQTAGKVAKGLAIGVAAVGAVGVAALAPLASQGLQYASSLNEVQNVVDTTFGKSASAIDSFAGTALKSYGLSTLQAKQYSSTLGTMYKSMGVGSQQTLSMSQNMTALAGDMASFYNLDPDAAFEKIRAGVSGETEPLKELGINMSVANLQAYAMSQGIKTNYNNMSQADQATLRYNYLMKATSDAQGDFSKTSGSFANQQRLLQTSLQQVSGEVMAKMLPALGAGMQQINGFIGSLDPDAIGDFVGQLASMAVAIIPLAMQLMPLVGNLLQMILPPLISIGQQIMPIIIMVVQTFLAALQPLIPPIMQFVQALLPPLMQILTAVAPLLIQIAGIVGTILGPALSFVVGVITNIADLISSVAKPFGDFLGKIGSFLGVSGSAQQQIAGVGSTAASVNVPAYANGGFSSRPSIFGEAGLEAAIPIRPGNTRSMGLLAKTAQMLGAGDRYQNAWASVQEKAGLIKSGLFSRLMGRGVSAEGATNRQLVQFTYAPVFSGGDRPPENMLKKDAQNIKRVLDDYFGDKGRLAWE
jgi:phage-related protein